MLLYIVCDTMLELNAKKREPGKALGTARVGGALPAVVYGPDQEATPISVVAREFDKLLKEAGTSTLVELHVDDASEPTVVIIKAVQRHPVKGEPTHVDLLAVKMGEEMHVQVPIVYVGEAQIEKAGEGTVVKNLREIEVAALPKDLPSEIEIDISVLATILDTITIGDVQFPEGVRAILNADELVANATAVKEEEVEEGAPEDTLSAEELEAQAAEAAEGGEDDDDASGSKDQAKDES